MSLNRRQLLVGTAASLVLGATACSGPSPSPSASQGATGSSAFRTLAEIQSSATVRIGVFSDKAPFGYVDADGNYAGYDIVYGDRIGADLGATVEYIPVEAASRVEFLETAKVDIILANFTVTPERSEKVDFSNPYMKVALGVVSPDDALITDEAQLADKELIVVKGTTAETWVDQTYPDKQAQKYDQYTEASSALSDGRGDAWITDNTEALAWAATNDGFTAAITDLGQVDVIAGAVTKGNTTVLTWLNEHLVTLGKEQFFHANFEQTLRPVYGEAVAADDLVVEGGQL